MRRQRHHVLDLAEIRGLDIVEPAHRTPAAIRQAWIDRGRDTELIVIRRRDQEIVDLREVMPGGAKEAGVERRPRPELLLDGGRRLPVVLAVAETCQDVRRGLRGWRQCNEAAG